MEFLDLLYQTISGMVNWRVTLDIFLITLVIFSVYRLFKSMGTQKILYGILVAASFLMIARILNLKGIQWIYQTLSPVIVISLIIIFQPEIRRLLEKTASFYRLQGVREQPDAPRLLSEVVFNLAQRKWGALIVIPGKDSIKSWISEGITINAVPSFPLLTSLFDPHSPGHDGAVILDNSRIQSFAVRLPLSTTENLSPEFGTRHHAALGLSEKTDALIIAVSEERGEITLFSDGKPCKIGRPKDLSKHIQNHFQTWKIDSPFSNSFKSNKRLFLELFGCLLLTVLFWSSVNLTENIEEPRAETRQLESLPVEISSRETSRICPIIPHVEGVPADSSMLVDRILVYPAFAELRPLDHTILPDSMILRTFPVSIDSVTGNIKRLTQLMLPDSVMLINPLSPFVEVVVLFKSFGETGMLYNPVQLQDD